ncbi:hypothetical protein HMPREF1548_05882 [Clostridium sp. KLE 1755]|nr:hypothetical protein HMPREF1548_05882 [Clostridium sp. KLE 1755]
MGHIFHSFPFFITVQFPSQLLFFFNISEYPAHFNLPEPNEGFKGTK